MRLKLSHPWRQRAVALAFAAPLFGGYAQTGQIELLERLQDVHAEGATHWIYNDWESAVEASKSSGKPIFVTFRCVPCEACRGFDAEVASGSERITQLASTEFTALRQVEMKGVDLSQFQFDYDLNWAAMFVNADGVVYARYGTQSAEGPDAYNSIDSLEKTMRRVLELHANYPNNRELFAGKRGEPKPYKTALEMPGLSNKVKLKGKTERANCIHCHMIHDAEHRAWNANDTFSIEKVWRYPLPDNLGLAIDASDGRIVERVTPNSPADHAGLQAGDEIVTINGQVITSIADMQWVFHNAPRDNAQFAIEYHRGDSLQTANVQTRENWKKTDFSWRGSMWSMPPSMGIWTPIANDEERNRHQIADSEPALVARWINQSRPNARAAVEAGLQTGDLILGINGEPFDGDAKEFHHHIRLNHHSKEILPLDVLRDGQRISIEIPIE